MFQSPPTCNHKFSTAESPPTAPTLSIAKFHYPALLNSVHETWNNKNGALAKDFPFFDHMILPTYVCSSYRDVTSDKRHAFLSFALHKIPVRQSWAFPKNMFFTSFVILLYACCEWENNLLHWPPSWWSLHYQLRSITLAASKVHVALWSFPLLTYMCDTTELMWHVYSIDARIQNMTKNGAQPSMTE